MSFAKFLVSFPCLHVWQTHHNYLVSIFAAELFCDRTKVHCLHRWQKHLDLELIKGPWTQEVEHPPSDPPTQPSATMGDIETISSLAEANDVLRNRGIDQVEGYQLVQFHLDERSSLLDAAEIKTRTRPGRVGFRLLNPELLDCK